MKSLIITILISFVSVVLLLLVAIDSIDRQVAFKDYKKGLTAKDCLFQKNCDYYNNL